ncbi:MAG TPA: CxxC-x17-CxxC domain-containing protein [Candidatus Andersenbacteria bacterium]|nr:CxxC-x17-CxxC domain-containing protein [Candidatus Andersenbacteria bacterium]
MEFSQLYPAICSSCGKHTEVPFKPDPEKEVFCKECYEKRKLEKNSQAIPKQVITVTLNQPPKAPNRQKPPTFTPPRPPKL